MAPTTAASTVLQQQGPPIGSSNRHPYGLTIRCDTQQHDGAVVQPDVIAHGQLGFTTNFGSSFAPLNLNREISETGDSRPKFVDDKLLEPKVDDRCGLVNRTDGLVW
ncbi:hypothetical protein GBA52_010552 [Prunus armeniaca]|nr:hypothetical protein GBA52_010552 [Prunus armeniaca]